MAEHSPQGRESCAHDLECWIVVDQSVVLPVRAIYPARFLFEDSGDVMIR